MRALPAVLLGACLACGGAVAGTSEAPGNPETIHVTALKDPEVRRYAAIVAGLDAFERHRAHAPAVDMLRFRIERQRDAPASELPALVVRLEGEHGFVHRLTPNADGDLVIPRIQAALDARSELTLNRKQRQVRVEPRIRTPGLPDNVRRLGDLRLECQVKVAIAKAELGTLSTLALSTLLLTPDWCSFHRDKQNGFSFNTGRTVTSAVLVDGNVSMNLKSRGNGFIAPLYDERWSDDALVELTFAAPPEVTGTAGETPRTDS